MHTWDVMPSTNYDHNWYGGIQIKSENQEIIASYQQQQLQTQSHTSTMDSSSSPGTSPQSMDTDGGLYFDSTNRPLGFNPLTPPGYPNAILSSAQHHIRNGSSSHISNPHNPNTPCKIFPKIESSYSTQTTLTPSHTPPMDVTPPKSPKTSDETPEKDIESISDNYIDSCDETRSMESDYEEDCIKPVSGKPGSNKPKKYKCKQCDHVSVTKTTFWEHVKGHIKPEKMLKCPKCPFVTEYKHHLEYHLRNHDGSKPFQCPNCNYSCVNKSMLNSHLKSHSNIYQYRCSDCNYATKYCHSLKLHLRKYNHKPAMVLNQDGTPNPLPIIDVYGTRRGPKTRSTRQRQNQQLKQQQQLLQQQQQQQLAAAQQVQHIEEPTQSTQIVTVKIPQSTHDLETQQHQAQNQQQQIPNLISSMLPNSLANMLHAGSNVPSMFPYLNLNLHMLAVRQQQNLLSQLSPNIQESALHSSSQDMDDEIKRRNIINSSNNSNHNNNNNLLPMRSSALDLTQPENINNHQHHHQQHNNKMYNEVIRDDVVHECDEEDDEIMPTSTSCIQGGNITPTTPLITGGGAKNRRKGRAFKLEMIKDDSESDDDSNKKNTSSNNNNNDNSSINNNNECIEINAHNKSSPSPPPPPPQQQQTITQQHAAQKPAEPSKSYDCKFCDISFKDAVLYTIHMGYHGYNDVFKCNMCGEKCDDRIAFFLHIARNPHS